MEVQLKYSAQIVSIRFTGEQKEEYDKLDSNVQACDSVDPAALRRKQNYIFDHFTPLPESLCKLLASCGEWLPGDWLEVAVNIGSIAEMSTSTLVTRNIFEVVYSTDFYEDFWCSIKSISLDKMVKQSGLPRYICDVIYGFHEEGKDEGLEWSLDAETQLHTIRR